MHHQIRLSDETLARLKAIAEPYVDREPEDTIRRLLALAESANRAKPTAPGTDNGQSRPAVQRSPARRTPRERGAVVEFGEHLLQAVSVRDLYEQALKHLVEEHRERLDNVIPFGTSRQRHLVARNPRHPTGNEFVIPVKYKGYYMEAHKDYRNAVRHLEQLATRLDIPMRYLG